VAAFFAGLDEDPVSALTAGVTGRAGLVPGQCAAAQALVTNLEWIHGRFTMCALRQFGRVPTPSVGAIAVPALVEHETFCFGGHRAGDLPDLLQSVLCLTGPCGPVRTPLRNSRKSLRHTLSRLLRGGIEVQIDLQIRSAYPALRRTRYAR